MTRGAQKKDRLLLGLAVSRLSLKPGEHRTHQQLADFCDCRPGTIQFIEAAALRKVKIALKGRSDIL